MPTWEDGGGAVAWQCGCGSLVATSFQRGGSQPLTDGRSLSVTCPACGAGRSVYVPADATAPSVETHILHKGRA